MNILLVEDDAPLSNALKKVLEKNGFNVILARDGEEAVDEILEKNYDLYLIDINLPKLNGHKLLKLIKTQNPKSIVVMITASAEIEDIEKAYDYGCNEYIKKPFHAKELLIRINKLIKTDKKDENIIKVENITFFKDTMDVLVDDKPFNLRRKEKKLLYILLENYNKTVKKEDIIKFVWGESEKEPPLRQLVSSLKSKLNNKNIVSVVGIGYRFVKL